MVRKAKRTFGIEGHDTDKQSDIFKEYCMLIYHKCYRKKMVLVNRSSMLMSIFYINIPYSAKAKYPASPHTLYHLTNGP